MRLPMPGISSAAMLCVALVMPAVAAEQAEPRTYTMADEGLLTLMVPKHWSDKRSQLSIALPRTLRFSADGGERFEVLVSGRWSGRQDPSVVEPSFVLSVTAHGAQIAAPQAEEEQIEVRSLPTVSGEAYLFSATDKNPKPGEYRYMVQGAVNVQGLVCTFTILSDEQDAAAVADAIEMIRTASFVYN